MQVIKATRDAILKPLQTVAGIIEKKHTLPVLANVLLTKQAEQVSFLGTDLEIQIRTSAELGSGKDNLETTISARKLIDILRSLPEDSEVGIQVANKKATLQAGKSRFSLQTLAADDFPKLAINQNFAASFALPQNQLKHLFQMVHFAMAQQDIRYYLNGLLLVTEGEWVKVVATDGHRLAFCQRRIEGANLAKQEVILPRKSVLELQRLLNDSDEVVHLDIAANQVRIRFAQVEMISKLVEGKFPDYQRVIPQGYNKHVLVDRLALGACLSRASILTNEKFKGIRLGLGDSILKVQITNTDQEEGVDELDVDYNAEALDIGFNVQYLQDVLSNLKTEQVQLSFGDSNTSALLTVPGDDSFKYVVMPMRI